MNNNKTLSSRLASLEEWNLNSPESRKSGDACVCVGKAYLDNIEDTKANFAQRSRL